ncbi:MAG TPA: ABC transporter ATP-binding protein/permease [Burkholderiaceae bacterium]|jgi:putative ATP-binding cassette transporter
MNDKIKNKPNWKAIQRLIFPYWRSEEKWKACGLLFTIVALVLGMVYLNVLFNSWNRDMFNALQEKNFTAFKGLLWRFSYLAVIYISMSIYKIYLTQALEMRWRIWLTHQYLNEWLANQAFYRVEQNGSADNPDQRIAEDLNSLTGGTLSLTLGLLSSVVTLVSFIGILWSVSGSLAFAFVDRQWFIPGYMVWFAVAYALIGSLLVWKVGTPLVEQNFNQQRFEANFRSGLVRIREYAEAIVLYRGERQEQRHLGERFEHIRANWWAIMRTTKRLNIVSTFYAQFAIIFPMLVAAPRYFSGAITLGVFTQISDAFAQVQDALSWFINAFSSLAEWKASINRLAGFHAAVNAVHEQETAVRVERNNVGAILIDQLSLQLPNGQVLSQALTTDLQVGQRILVAGPSGCGKSTLFRAMAGIWPYGAGSIEIPNELKLLFLPQKSYLPIGTLRAAVSYPAADNAYKDLAIQHYLELCQLKHLIPLLAETDNWSQRLSPGEQQRLAFVRVLLTRPDVLFLDEATSALDADTEEILYGLVLQELPQAAVISIAHRETVVKYHHIRWQFSREDMARDETDTSLDMPGYTIEIAKIGKLSKVAPSFA